jgi:glycosyltransferase involved in cell wall biosynthesis
VTDDLGRDALTALTARLRAVAGALDVADVSVRAADTSSSGVDAACQLSAVIDRIDATKSRSEMWLLLVGLSGSFPVEEDILELARRLELDGAAQATIWLLERAHHLASTVGSPLNTIEIVTGSIVVDVNYVSQHDLHTGIQRVARETLPRWSVDRDIILAAWTSSQAAMRGLTPIERGRVVAWGRTVDADGPDASDRLIVPWATTLLVPEILQYGPAPYLRALARFSGNRVVHIGYDCIPITSGEVVPDFGSEVFAKYLSAVKYADIIIGISASATEEFLGFSQMLAAQGLAAPEVHECLLPVDAPPATVNLTPTDRPLILCVGSHGPHKNHLAVLHAAEILWREGLEFDLLFVGGSGWMSLDFDSRVRVLRRAGRGVTIAKQMPDAELWESYQTARFTVFPSWHEGFGLPVAESLFYGTPAITSDFGSMQEIGVQGGCILIDPRSDTEITAAIRRLLTDDDLLQRLQGEARARTQRSWDDYADELWQLVIGTTEALR